MRYWTWVVLALSIAGRGESAELQYKQRLTAELVKQVPGILKLFDPQTGHFGSGLWICGDQERMYPLAVAYGTPAPANRYFKSPELLAVIVKAGDALISDADPKGQWMFRKKDGSTWGMVWMPWTYSRWIRTYSLIREDLPPDRREAWANALQRGYTGISQSGSLSGRGAPNNIATHHAMGLYAAGKALDRPEWCRQAADVLMKVVGEQSAAGYWSEGGGPVVLYDFVYVDALGVYYDRTGLILGGGNTKLQPAWSNFTVGDAALLAHRPGDDNPHFLPQGRLYHVPSAAELVRQPELGLNLTYGPERCRIRILPKDDRTLQYRLQTTGESGLPVAAHLTLMPHFGRPLETAAGQKFVLGDAPIELGSDQIGGWISHAGCRLRLPAMASLHWPRLPHNPYAKDGRCSPQDGRIEIAIPLNPGHPECEITLEILP